MAPGPWGNIITILNVGVGFTPTQVPLFPGGSKSRSYNINYPYTRNS
jgi:hypothetical protein